jgi:hypothetical protein
MAYDITKSYSNWDEGEGTVGRACRNRKVLSPDGRRHSPSYDDEGETGGAWHEWGIADDAYCTFGGCTKTDRTVWEKFTERFFSSKFKPALDNLKQSGLISDEAKKAIKNGDDLVASYNAHTAHVRKINPGFWSPMDLSEAIEGTINHLDEAACQRDFVIDPLLEVVAGRPGKASGPAHIPVTGAPGGGAWINGGGRKPPPKEGASPGMIAVGVVLLGAASYFGYKVLTE